MFIQLKNEAEPWSMRVSVLEMRNKFFYQCRNLGNVSIVMLRNPVIKNAV